MWINPTTGQAFTLHADIRAAFNTSFPAELADDNLAAVGLLPVTPTLPPAFDRRAEKVVASTPLLIDGKWTQQWAVVALTTGEQAAMVLQIQQEIIAATQDRLDAFAQTRNYDNILSACTYATDIDATFSAEGQYCVAARGATWRKLYEILDEVNTGIRPEPTCYADIEPELPPLNWPD